MCFCLWRFPKAETCTSKYATGSSNHKSFRIEIWNWSWCLSGELMTMISFLRFWDKTLEAHGSQQQNILIITCGHLYQMLMKSKVSFRTPTHCPGTIWKEESKDYRLEWLPLPFLVSFLKENDRFKPLNFQFKAYVNAQELTVEAPSEFPTSESHTAERMENQLKVGLRSRLNCISWALSLVTPPTRKLRHRQNKT